MTRLEDCSCYPDKVIKNFVDYKLTDSEKSVLWKGLKFAIPPNKPKYVGFVLPFMFLFCDIKSSNLSFPQTKPVKLKILDITSSSFDCFNGNKIKINFCGKEFKALHNLRKQKHLVIKKADKDNVLQILRTLSFTIFMAFIQILLNMNIYFNQNLLTFWLYVRQTWMS